MLSDLECAIRSLEHQINRQKNFVYWFLVPAGTILLTRMVTDFDSKPLVFWLGVPAIFVAIALATRWEVNSKLIPKLEDLNHLRELLVEERE